MNIFSTISPIIPGSIILGIYLLLVIYGLFGEILLQQEKLR